jgi:hypothetical protein
MSNLPVYLELLSKLSLLKEAMASGFLVRMVGSPLRELNFLIADLLKLSAESARVNRSEVLNFGVKFEESSQISEEDYESLPQSQATAYFFDPVDEVYYLSKSDPLGNPLQIEIPFEGITFSRKDALHIADGIESISQFFDFLALGRIDFDFLRRISGKTGKTSRVSQSTKPISSGKDPKQRKRYFYHNRFKVKASGKSPRQKN